MSKDDTLVHVTMEDILNSLLPSSSQLSCAYTCMCPREYRYMKITLSLKSELSVSVYRLGLYIVYLYYLYIIDKCIAPRLRLLKG